MGKFVCYFNRHIFIKSLSISPRFVLERNLCPTLFALANVITNDASITKACMLVWGLVPVTTLVVAWVITEVIILVGNGAEIISNPLFIIDVQINTDIHPPGRILPIRSTVKPRLSSTVFKKIWIRHWSIRPWMMKVSGHAISLVNWSRVQLRSNAKQVKLTTAAKVRLICMFRDYGSIAVYCRWARHTLLLWWIDPRRIFLAVWRLRGRYGRCCSGHSSSVRMNNFDLLCELGLLLFIRLNIVTALCALLATICFTMWHRQGQWSRWPRGIVLYVMVLFFSPLYFK